MRIWRFPGRSDRESFRETPSNLLQAIATLTRSDEVILLPSQPISVSGNSEYPYGGFNKTPCGRSEKASWIFRPAIPRLLSAPLVVV